MDTLASSCRVAGTDTGKWAVRRTALTLSLEAQSVGEGLGPQPEGERGSRVGNEAVGQVRLFPDIIKCQFTPTSGTWGARSIPELGL